eukprot:CAMPEP_0173115998 /NCGR_PEP_ID=MMETSP1102-20130122/48957_1 /TAXON_ID=49646 /ORGANISM="Geminigera sp., Strain Caron Lab Isolate" /LENGTH=62 /DNA_ID=CAMNT_0014019387 /DNA_START=1 /DNA_END=189 /DNA_ORIENTATION=-
MFPGASAKPYYALQTGQIDVVLGPQASQVVLGAQHAGLDRGAPFAKSRLFTLNVCGRYNMFF